MKLYALLDKKMGEFGPVLVANNDGHMSRLLQERMDQNQTVAKYPADFDLYELGSYEVETGKIEPVQRFVCNMGVLLQGGE